MKHLLTLATSILLLSCSQGALQNEDISNHLIGESGILNQVNIGDDWAEVKKLTGDYWALQEDKSANIYQFRKDIDLSDEVMFVDFQILDNQVAAVGVNILSANISDAAFLLYKADLAQLYKKRFGIDLTGLDGDDTEFNGISYHHAADITMEEGKATALTIFSFRSS